MKRWVAILLIIWGCNNSADVTSVTADSTTEMLQPEDTANHTVRLPIDTATGTPVTVHPPIPTDFHRNDSTTTHPGITHSKPISNTKINTPQERGWLTYAIPPTMIYKRSYTIRFDINRDTSNSNITTAPSSTKATIHTSSTMSVELIDPLPEGLKAFQISKSTTDVQLVEENDATDWIFTVVPIRRGKHDLNIVVSIIRDGNKKQTVYTNSVQVHAPAILVTKSFFAKYWQWIIGTLLLPFFVYLWQRRRKA